jgi:hypothetical protein
MINYSLSLRRRLYSAGFQARAWVLLAMLALSIQSLAAPEADLWSRWQTHDPNSTQSIDHTVWDIFLSKYVYPFEDGQYRVAYISVHNVDRQKLDGYIISLSGKAVSRLNKEQQLAYWINLYNALTMQLVLQAYPVASIRDIDISPGVFSNGPWDRKLVQIEGEAVSLNDIEHRILRPIWKDPRLHYVLNCAALGCPNLGVHAVTAQTTEQIMDQAARAYINHPRGVRLDAGALYASSIYDWYVGDFGGSGAGVLQHLRRYADAPLALLLEGRTTIDGYHYDWALNGVEPSIALKIKKRGS